MLYFGAGSACIRQTRMGCESTTSKHGGTEIVKKNIVKNAATTNVYLFAEKAKEPAMCVRGATNEDWGKWL